MEKSSVNSRLLENCLDLFDDIIEIFIPGSATEKDLIDRKNGFRNLMNANFDVSNLPVKEYRNFMDMYRSYIVHQNTYAKNLKSKEVKNIRKMEKRLEFEREIRPKVSRKFDRLAQLGFTAMAFYTQYKFGMKYSLPLAFSVLGLEIDKLNNPDPKIASQEKLGSYFIATLPALEFLADYLITGDSSYGSRSLRYFSAPFFAFTNSIAIPWLLLSANEIDFHAKTDKIFYALKAPKKNKEKLKRMEHVLWQIYKLQIMNISADYLNSREYVDFEKACIDYLDEKSDKQSLGRKMESIIYMTKSFHTQKGKSQKIISSTMSPKNRAEMLDQKTYETIISLGIENDLALKLAISVDSKRLDEVIERLKIQFQEQYTDVISANPSLLFMNNHKLEKYFAELGRTLKLISKKYGDAIPEEYSYQANSVVFASKDGLKYLQEKLVGNNNSPSKNKAEVLIENIDSSRYRNKKLLEGILMGGFKLDSPHPRIGMYYILIENIKSRVRNYLDNDQEMEDFDETFGHLILDGVILPDKQYKNSGGKFPGCYSVTSSIRNINDENLRKLVRYLKYEGRRCKV